MGYTDMILTALTFVTGMLAVVNFFASRRKDNKEEGAQEATLRSDLQYIKDVLIDVRRETKETNQLVDKHSERIAHIEERVKYLEKRIDNKND